MNVEQLAYAAERRTWALVISADEQVNGLDPSRVLAHAKSRAAWLDERLGGRSEYEMEDALASAEPRDRSAAWCGAVLAMRHTLSMIERDQELSQ